MLWHPFLFPELCATLRVMNTTLAGLTALLIYAALALWQYRSWAGANATPSRTAFLAVATIALLMHGYSVYLLIDTPSGFHFGFFRVSSLIFWVINITVVASSLKLPVHPLLAPLFALSAISVACSLFIDSAYAPQSFSYPIALHILLSILAYSILTIAAAQAIALSIQDRLLKHHRLQGVMTFLPPLQTMESLLFEMLHAGTVLLGLAIGTGLLFFDDIGTQHLAHKIFFSLVALAVYCVLLWGRHRHGWRGKKAIRWALGGFVSLMLAYFGTKLVLEILLQGS